MIEILAVIAVSTPAELTTAIDGASPGDEIVLADGTYRMTGATCDTAGTEAMPIVVRAASPLGAKIEFDGLEGFKVTAAHWHFEDLDITGVCATDSNCEHAFHVYGAAHGFVLRRSRVRDFNAQLKVNASQISGTYVTPNNGLIEYNELGDTRTRNTSNPVTKLNIDTGDDWIVRGNYLHDAHKGGGDTISYAAFMKSGGNRGLFERNLVICSKDTTGGTRIGLSFGGGGTGNAFCAPAFDSAVPCTVEHRDGIIRNNIIANCSDVGIYLNEATNTKVLYNTLIGTAGVDFRFMTTSGEARGNVATGMIRTRDQATMTAADNMTAVAVSQFSAWYQAPLAGDLTVVGDVSSLIGAGPAHASIVDDYCGQTRPAGALTLGAIEHSLPGCDTTRPPMTTDPMTPGGDAGAGGDGGTDPTDPPESGCCQSQRSPDLSFLLILLIALGIRRR